jgi:hypothetical protein
MTVKKNTCARKKSRSKPAAVHLPGGLGRCQSVTRTMSSPDRDHFIFFNQANMSAGHQPDRGSHERLRGGRRVPDGDESIVKKPGHHLWPDAAGQSRHREVVSAEDRRRATFTRLSGGDDHLA